MERGAPAFGRFAVPTAILQLFAQKLIGQRVVRFLEIRADAEDSAVDAGLRFPAQERPVVEPLKRQSLIDTVDHLASLLAGEVQSKVLQDDETIKGDNQSSVRFRQVGPPGFRPPD